MGKHELARLQAATVIFMGLAVVTSCTSPNKAGLPGTLEWDRAAVLAEVSERVVAVAAREGDWVAQGDILLRLDPRKIEARLAGAQAEVSRATAALAKLRRGTRSETVAAARAELARANAAASEARREFERAAALRKAGAIAQAALDQAKATLASTEASARGAQARLNEAVHGARPEDLAQAEAALAGARATLAATEIELDRVEIRAPHDGRIDAMPFHPGDQPPVGATLVSLLTGPAPYARVYIPERMRSRARPGDSYHVYVDGYAAPFTATLESVESASSFTPYYALSGDDAERLVYRAELRLYGNAAAALPAGLPVRAERADAVAKE